MWRSPAHTVKSPYFRRFEILAEVIVKFVHGTKLQYIRATTSLLLPSSSSLQLSQSHGNSEDTRLLRSSYSRCDHRLSQQLRRLV